MKLLTNTGAIIIGVLLLISIASVAVAQEEGVEVIEEEQTAEDGLELVQSTTRPNIQQVSIELFEDPTLWQVHISRDDGYSIHQRFEGGPNAKIPITPEQVGGREIQDENVLGVKTEFIRRGFTEIVFRPERPIPVPGVVQEISIWVAGRELEHDLYLIIRDIDGALRKIFVDRLNYRGWQQLTAQIPPYAPLGGERLYVGVKQYDPRRPLDTGIELVSLVIEPLFTEAYGTYYVYFDDMRASTDLSVITLRDPDDIVDAW